MQIARSNWELEPLEQRVLMSGDGLGGAAVAPEPSESFHSPVAQGFEVERLHDSRGEVGDVSGGLHQDVEGLLSSGAVEAGVEAERVNETPAGSASEGSEEVVPMPHAGSTLPLEASTSLQATATEDAGRQAALLTTALTSANGPPSGLGSGDEPTVRPISSSAAAAISAGVSGFTDWMDTLGAHGQFSQSLPGLQETLGAALNLKETFLARLSQPIVSYFGADATPTVGELRSVLEGLDASVGDLVFRSTVIQAGIFGASGQEELRFDVTLDFRWTRTFEVDIRNTAGDALYLLNATPAGGLGMSLDLSLGVNLTPALPAEQAFFIRTGGLHAGFDLHVANLNAGVAVGFLGADIQGGRIDAEADLVVGIGNPDGDSQGRITLAELRSTPLSSLVSVTASGGLSAEFPISAHLGSWTLSGNPRITVSLSDPFGGQPQVQYNLDATPTLSFRSLNASSFLGLLGQLAAWGDSWMSGSGDQTTLLDREVPFATGHTFGKLLGIGQAIRTTLITPLQSQGAVLPFRTAQELAAKLAEVLQIPLEDTGLTYDAVKGDLSYRIAFTHALDPLSVPLAFNVDLKPLASLSTDGTVAVTSSLSGGVTLGVTLSSFSAAVEGKVALPANGRLAGDAIFRLGVNGAAPVSVVVAADSTNATRADLVQDVNGALLAAGVSNLVTASVDSAGRLMLTVNRPLSGVSLFVWEANAAAEQLGLTANSSALDTLADHAWLENASFTGTVAVNATDIQASATLGFLDIEVTQGQVSASATVSARLKDGENGEVGGRISVRKLLLGMSEDPLLNMAFQFSGVASASLQHIRVVDNFLGVIEGNPTVSVNWADITKLNTLQVTLNGDMNPIRALENLAAGKLIDLLTDVHKWLVEVEKSSFFTRKLPIINRSPNDLLGLSKRLEKLIADIRKDPPKSIQKLEKLLLDKLGLAGTPATSGDPLGDEGSGTKVSFSDRILTIDLKLNESFDGPVPFSLSADLTSLGLPSELKDLVALGGSGLLNVTAKADARLVFGFDLRNALLPAPYIRDDTRADLTAKMAASDLAFSVALGPMGLFVVNGTARLDDGATEAEARKPATLTVTMDSDATDHRYSILEAFSKFNVDLRGYAQASLPLYFPTKSNPISPALVFTVADLSHPLSTSTLSGPNLGAFLSQLNVLSNLEAIRNGWDEMLGLVEELLKRNVFGRDFPLVGDQLNGTLDFIHRMREQLKGNLGLLPSMGVVAVQEALFAGLGPSGLNWLQDRESDADTLVTASDIVIQSDGTDYVQFNMVLAEQRNLLKADLDFDIGLPALGIDLEGAVAVGGGFRWDLRFGVSKTDGVYIDTSASGPEFKVNFGATISNFEAVGRLGFLEVRAKDDPADPSAFGGTFEVDFIAPSAQTARLRLRDLQTNVVSWDQAIDVALEAKAEINLKLVAGFSKIGVMPSLEADFNLVWDFTPGDGDLKGSVPTVAFNNVRLNLGSFFSSFAGPVLKRIQEVLRPVQPVIDALNTRVPVLSDLLGEDLNFFELAKRFGNPTQVKFAEFLEAAAEIVTLINSVPVIEGNQYIQLGSFNLLGTDVRTAGSVETATPNTTVTTNPVSQLTGDAAAFYNRTQDVGKKAMSFPLLENPMQAFRLLLGQDVDLFLYDMPALELSVSYAWYIPVLPPIFIELGGGIGARLDLAFGYDTSGLREFARTGYVSDVFDGFYVSDRLKADGTGADVPEVKFWASVYAAIEVNFVVLWAGIKGGITANIDLNLKDPDNDGRVHAEEFLQTLDGDLLSSFDVSGALEAYLNAYVRAGFKRGFVEIVLWEWELEIVRVTLADFRTPQTNPIWDGGGDGTSWSDARNWQGDRLPTASDNVIINVPNADVTVKLPVNLEAKSIRSKETLSLESGTLDRVEVQSRHLIVANGGRFFMRNGFEVEHVEVMNSGLAILRAEDMAQVPRIEASDGGTLTFNGQLNGSKIEVSPGALAHVGSSTALWNSILLDGDVRVDSGKTLSIQNGLTLMHGHKISTIGTSLASSIKFVGNSQTLGGIGEVAFSGSFSFNYFISDVEFGQSLTIGPWVKVGTDIGRQSGTIIASQAIVLEGEISASAPGRTVTVAGNVTNANGKLSARDNGTLIFEGTLNNHGSKLVLDPGVGANAGNLRLNGRINGGTLKGVGLGLFRVASTGAVWNGVTLDGDVSVDSGGKLSLENGLTLANGHRVQISSAGLTTTLSFKGASQVLGGSGEIVFGGLFGGVFETSLNVGQTLTIGSGVTVHSGEGGQSGTIYSNQPIILQGTIAADEVGETITIVSNAVVTNKGTIKAVVGTVTFSGAMRADPNGKIVALDGGAVVMSGTLDNSGTTLVLDGGSGASAGTLRLNGRINGGIIRVVSGGQAHVASATAAWNGVVLDGDVWLDTAAMLSVENGLTLANGHKVSINSTSASTSLRFAGVGQTLGGIGEVVFGGTLFPNYFVSDLDPGHSLTVGPLVTVGNGVGGQGGTILANQPIVLQGEISARASGKTVTIAGNVTNANGKLSARDNGTLIFEGTLNNDGSKLTLDPGVGANAGNLRLNGRINGGTLKGVGLGLFRVASTGAVWNGVTLDGDVSVDSGGKLSLENGLTLVNGHRVQISSAGLTTTLSFKGASQVLGGSGDIVFGGLFGGVFETSLNVGQTLTIGSGVTVHSGEGGQSGTIYSNQPIVLQGTIAADEVGETISIVSNAVFTNKGTIKAVGGTLDFNGELRVEDQGILAGTTLGTIQISGNLLGTTLNANHYAPGATVLFDGIGTAGVPQELEAMSVDMSNDPAGFLNNFVYDSLAIGSRSYVKLVDRSDNTSSAEAESVYVNSIIVPAGATLNLNGLHLYARTAQIRGTVLGGSILPTGWLSVIAISPNESGVALRFNRAFDLRALNLYATQTGGQGPADVTLVGVTTGPVSGSLVPDPDSRGLRFLKTGGALAVDTYTLTLNSAANGFIDMGASVLDGNGDGVPGGNYVKSFNVLPSSALLSIPDIARGPGQPVNLPATASGLPVTLSDAVGASMVDFTLNYDTTLLTVTGVTLGSGAPVASTLSIDASQAGRTVVHVTLSSAITSTAALELVRIQSVVPLNAGDHYTQKMVLDLDGVIINRGAMAGRADDGVFVNAYVGDANANRGYNTLDVQRLQRVVVRLDTGFAAYPLLDPAILGDTTGNGSFNSLDVLRMQQKVVGLPQTSIPQLPTLPLPVKAFLSAGQVVSAGMSVARGDIAAVGLIEIAQSIAAVSRKSNALEYRLLANFALRRPLEIPRNVISKESAIDVLKVRSASLDRFGGRLGRMLDSELDDVVHPFVNLVELAF